MVNLLWWWWFKAWWMMVHFEYGYLRALVWKWRDFFWWKRRYAIFATVSSHLEEMITLGYGNRMIMHATCSNLFDPLSYSLSPLCQKQNHFTCSQLSSMSQAINFFFSCFSSGGLSKQAVFLNWDPDTAKSKRKGNTKEQIIENVKYYCFKVTKEVVKLFI